ncbi:MAG: 2-amino-4-deoxychorismate dehydrogenase [Candidatus Parcubacteria bacterium]|jgi:multimeric flavodoxin WrbA
MPTKEPLVLIINGSPKEDGRTDFLTDRAYEGVNRVTGVRCEVIFLRDEKLPPFNGELDIKPQDGCLRVVELIREADGVIFVSPTYWFTYSSLIKNLVEIITCLDEDNYAMAGKVAGVFACCDEDGASRACIDLIGTLVMMGFTIPGHAGFFYNKGSAPYSENNWQNKDHRMVGELVARFVLLCLKYLKSAP